MAAYANVLRKICPGRRTDIDERKAREAVRLLKDTEAVCASFFICAENLYGNVRENPVREP